MGGKGGIVSAAVFHMEHQSNIQNAGFKFGEAAVRAKNVENIFRSGELRLRCMDKKAISVMIMAVGLISVDRQKREETDQLKTLTQYIGNGNVICSVII